MLKGLEENGVFIAFEGTDGCGKTTTLKIVKNILAKKNVPVVYTKEPAGTPYGEKIRKELINPDLHFNKLEQAKLFEDARRDHLKKVVLPAIAHHKVVICDRYVLSSLAYQGDYVPNPYYLSPDEREATLSKYSKADRELAVANDYTKPYTDKNHILERNKALPEYITPNLNVYLQASPETDIHRLNKRAEKSDKYDKALEDLQNMRHLQKQYKCAIQDMDTPHLLVNADYSPEERALYIAKTILEMVNDEPTPHIYPFVPF